MTTPTDDEFLPQWFVASYEDEQRRIGVGIPDERNSELCNGLIARLQNLRNPHAVSFGISKEGARQLCRLLEKALEAKPGEVPFTKIIKAQIQPEVWTYIVEPKEPK